MINLPSKKEKTVNQSNSEQEGNKEEMHQYWLNYPTEDLAALFSAELTPTNRAVKFKADKAMLTQLFDSLDDSPIEIRIYMAANPATSLGVDPEKPSFSPIIQAYNINNKPSDVTTNSYFLNYIFVPIGEEPDDNGRVIPRLGAAQIISAWRDYRTEALPALFESDQGRLRSYTFDAADAEQIRTIFNNATLPDVRLSLYLAYLAPEEPVHIFGFRTVLEINNGEGTIVPSTGVVFFEFSNPCPPLCG